MTSCWHGSACLGCTTHAEAEKYEKNKRALVMELLVQKSDRALIENFHARLANIRRVTLEEAGAEFFAGQIQTLSRSHFQSKQSVYRDFCAYMHTVYPEVQCVADVEKTHAEHYVTHLCTHGRFQGRGKRYRLSASSVATFTFFLRHIFNQFSPYRTGPNPFASIRVPRKGGSPREAYTDMEIRRLLNCEDFFIRALFTVGFFTALRAGDICTLKWSEIDREAQYIKRQVRKTGAAVEIPIMPALLAFLETLPSENEWVLPEHARCYLRSPSGVSKRVKATLSQLGIAHRKRQESGRAVSTKDIHSLRHTFCYFAGLSGMPQVIVQSIVGHMTPAMTEHYMRHASRSDKAEKIGLLNGFVTERIASGPRA